MDVSQNNHVLALVQAERTAAVSPIPSRTDVHDPAHPFDWQHAPVPCDESKPHLLRSAKNWVAFFTPRSPPEAYDALSAAR